MNLLSYKGYNAAVEFDAEDLAPGRPHAGYQ